MFVVIAAFAGGKLIALKEPQIGIELETADNNAGAEA